MDSRTQAITLKLQMNELYPELAHEKAIIDRLYMKLIHSGNIRVNLHEDSYLLEDIEKAVNNLLEIQNKYKNVLREQQR